MAEENDNTLEFTTSVITPESIREDKGNTVTEKPQKTLEQQLEEAQLDAKKSADALEALVTGVRAVKRILDRHAEDDSASTNSVTVAEEEDLLARISKGLHGVLGSDLLALANSANMARGHAKLTSEEASALVSDIHAANEKAKEAEIRAQKAEKLSRKLYKENLALQQQVGQLKGERRTLVKAVKELRQVQEETNKFDSWRLLEEHVHNSISIHEMIMRTPTSGARIPVEFETPVVVEKSDAFQTSPVSNSADNESGRDDCERLSVSTEKKSGSSSPPPGLEEATASCSEDSLSYRHEEGEIRRMTSSIPRDRDGNTMPKNVSLSRFRPTSPLETPNMSPAGVTTSEFKPVCNPNILRTLAIPSGEKDERESLPSPRLRVAPGLYEV
eukprot:scaffold24796_cov211-Cylindrotheca_fusiformis.AAC.3